MHTSERSTTLDEFDESSLSPKRNCGTREFLLALSLLAHFWLARNPDLSLPSETSMCLAPTERDLKNPDNYLLGEKKGEKNWKGRLRATDASEQAPKTALPKPRQLAPGTMELFSHLLQMLHL